MDPLTKSGLRQFVAGALMRAWESREAATRGGSDRGKYNFKSITADETEFMFLMLCPCLDGLVDAGAALNAHRGRITPRPAPVEDPMPDCIHACGLLLSWYSNSMTAMLTIVNSVKTLTKSVAVSLLDNQNRTQAGQSTWKCGLPAEFIDGDQITLQELMSLKRMPQTTLDGNHHNRQV